MPDIPPIARVSYAEHAESAAAAVPEAAGLDAVARARVVRDATLIAPLQRVQVATDQLVRNVEDSLRRPGATTLDDAARAYCAAELGHCRELAAVLATAAGAARSMVAAIEAGVARLDPPPPAPEPAAKAAPKAKAEPK